MKILLADDEQLIRKGLAALDWASIGVQVVAVAENGIEARDLTLQHRPDIALVDIRMPGLSGIEYAEFIQTEGLSCKVIFLSGYNQFDYAQKAIRTGASDYILKPSDPAEIFLCVQKAIQEIEHSREIDKKIRVHEISEQLQDQTRGTSEPIDRILSYISSRYQENISLSLLSEELHFNPSYVSRYIKKKTGHNFSEMLTSVRIKKAAELLVHTNCSVTEISSMVGISDYKYFSQVFKKMLGTSPTEYKKAAAKPAFPAEEAGCTWSDRKDAGR